MDESGFPPESARTQRVLGRRGTKIQHKQGTANRENVTVLVTICADGGVLRPTIIFKGKNIQQGWGANNPSHASFACSPNGWTDGELALKWMIDDFDAQTRAKANGRLRALFLDGHSSHYIPELLQYAINNSIILLGYPPHCTHALQGLDVICFARMKQSWCNAIDAFELQHCRGINKSEFAGVFGIAFAEAFTPDTVKAAFEKTGIYPFNPNIITANQMKPSEPHSTQSYTTLLFIQTSPMKAIVDAWGIAEAINEPVTPTRRRSISEWDPNIDPVLYTPAATAKAMQAALAQTSSGAYLVSKS
ncbi:hypothetical protein M422DRAFT_157164, partial [Sphaerobolus stellatus SS14]